MISAAVLGYGTIGSGVYEVIKRNRDILTKNAGEEIQVKYVLDLREFPGDPAQEVLTHDFNDILNDEEVSIVCETMGGTGAAYTFTKAALDAGKSVVTSNKAVVAAYGPELLAIAKEKGASYLFEAAVGGGIPVLRPLVECITADEIEEITGILNGTTNFILTKMYNEGSAFEPTLKEAQDLGYAERDPSADIEGADACRKIAILASLANRRFVDFEQINCTGITKITDTDTAFAKALGKKIKLVGTYKSRDGMRYAEVAPVIMGSENPLYSVDDVMNAVLVKGNMLGDVMFYGAGAGKLPTASAVVSDIVDIVRAGKNPVSIEMAPEGIVLDDAGQLKSRYFIRASKEALLKVFEEIVSLDSVPDEAAAITDELTASELEAKVKDIPQIGNIIKVM